MFPLLDLDDDALAATLGFSDPRTLCAATMTCRRLRILADEAWRELEKHIPQDKREEGTTPRERVLSSFVIHGERWQRVRIQRFAMRVHRDINNEMQCITSEALKTDGHLFYICITNRFNLPVDSLLPLGMSQKQYADLTGDFKNSQEEFRSVEVPLPDDLSMGHFHPFFQKYKTTTHIVRAAQMSFEKLRKYDKDSEYVFSGIGIVIVALNRRTLTQHVFFKKLSNSAGLRHPMPIIHMTPVRDWNGPWQVKVGVFDRGAKNYWAMEAKSEQDLVETRATGFYLKDGKFGLVIMRDKQI